MSGMTDFIVQGERVVLPVGSDPAITRVEGFLRYVIGVDLGSAIDPTGISIIEDKQLPEWKEVDGRKTALQQLAPRSRTVVAVDQLRQHAYGEIAEYIRALLMRPPIAGRSTLVIDASGVGRAFSSTLDEAQIPHMAVQMTAGANAVRAGRFWNVGKSVLLTDLAGALENGTLSILKRLPLKDLLLEELASFETKTTAAGNSVLASTAKTSHADMATALALAWFATERAGGFVGEGKLAGWY